MKESICVWPHTIFITSILLFYFVALSSAEPNQCNESNSGGSCSSEQLVPTQRSSSFQTSSQ